MEGYRLEAPYFQYLPQPPVPNLPGYNALASVGRENQSRQKSSLVYKHGVPMVAEQDLRRDPLQLQRHSWLGDETAAAKQQQQQQQERPRTVLTETMAAQNRQGAPPIMQWTGRKAPGWLLYSNKMLYFLAYFTESVDNNPLEQIRVRRFQIRYHMEDNSIEVIELAAENSGLPLGKFLHKNKIKLADGSDLGWEQLRVGAAVTIYSRTFHVIACDNATREHFSEYGIAMAEDAPFPDGTYDVHVQEAAQAAAAAREASSKATAGGKNPNHGPGAIFVYQNTAERRRLDSLDKIILRFFCVWDDAKHPSGLTGKGQRLPFALHYYPSDDTIEIVEIRRENTGRDPFPLLLSRRQLPQTPNVPPVGGKPMSPRTRSLLNIKYYNWRELKIGRTVTVYGRDMLIYDCDACTKQWYKDYAGWTEASCVPLEIDFDMKVKRPELPIPVNQCGFGSEEDSLRNVLNLIPRRKPSNYHNYMDNWNKVLRFRSRMVPVSGQRELISPHDATRRFVVSFHVLDGTIAIFEPKMPNSGIRGGTYLERTKVFKVDANSPTANFHSQREVISHGDMQVGSVLNIFARGFELSEADEHTLKHMEDNPDEYPHSCLQNVLEKVQMRLDQPGSLGQVRDALLLLDGDGLGLATAPKVQDAINGAGFRMTLHEALTLVRGIGSADEGVVGIMNLIQALQLPERRDERDGLRGHGGQAAGDYEQPSAPDGQRGPADRYAADAPPPQQSAWSPPLPPPGPQPHTAWGPSQSPGPQGPLPDRGRSRSPDPHRPAIGQHPPGYAGQPFTGGADGGAGKAGEASLPRDLERDRAAPGQAPERRTAWEVVVAQQQEQKLQPRPIDPQMRQGSGAPPLPEAGRQQGRQQDMPAEGINVRPPPAQHGGNLLSHSHHSWVPPPRPQQQQQQEQRPTAPPAPVPALPSRQPQRQAAPLGRSVVFNDQTRSRGGFGGLSLGVEQPKSLWQTTNMSIGGVHHGGSVGR